MDRSSSPVTVSSACPDPDTLAAYLDRRLPEGERGVIEAHVDACADCYAVFVDTVAALDHVGARARSGVFRRYVGWGASLAAAGLAVVLLRPVWQGGGRASSPGANPVAYLAESAGARALGAANPEIPPRRGGESTGAARRLAFRLGVHDADLEVALRIGDRGRAEATARAVAAMLGPRATFYEEVLSRIAAPATAGSLADEVASGTGPRRAGLDPGEWERGRWVETTRRAALARQLSFLRDQEVRSRLLEATLGAPFEQARRLEEALAGIDRPQPDAAAWDSLTAILIDLARGDDGS